MKVYERGGVRVAFKGDDVIVYVDVDKLMAVSEIDVPEIEAFRFSKSDAKSMLSKAWDDVKAEWRRFQKRRTKGEKRVPK